MSTVVQAIPDVNVLLALAPEELGAKLLFLAKARQKFDGDMFYPSNFETEIWEADTRGQPSYPRNRQAAIALAFSEAWAWLEAQGLIVPAADTNGRNGFRVLSRRARRFASEAEICGRQNRQLLCPGFDAAKWITINATITNKNWQRFALHAWLESNRGHGW